MNIFTFDRESCLLASKIGAKVTDVRGVAIQVSKLVGNSKGETKVSKSISAYLKANPNDEAPKKDCRIHEAKTEADITFSQVDPEVLRALPQEIRQELEEDFLRRKKRKQRCNSEAESVPSTSSRSGGSAAVARGGATGGGGGHSLLDVTLSRVDSSYLAALPPELAEELQEALKRPKENKDGAQSDPPKTCIAFQEIMNR